MRAPVGEEHDHLRRIRLRGDGVASEAFADYLRRRHADCRVVGTIGIWSESIAVHRDLAELLQPIGGRVVATTATDRHDCGNTDQHGDTGTDVPSETTGTG